MVLTIGGAAEDERGHVDRSAGIGQREDQEQGADTPPDSPAARPHITGLVRTSASHAPSGPS